MKLTQIPGLNCAFNYSYQFIRCRNFNHASVRNGNLDLISEFQVDLRYWNWKVVSFSYLIILWIDSECEKCILCLLILLSFDFYQAHTRIQHWHVDTSKILKKWTNQTCRTPLPSEVFDFSSLILTRIPARSHAPLMFKFF